MGGVYAPESFVFWSHRRGAIPGRDPFVIKLEKINRSFLQNEFHKDCRRFLENLVSTVISTVAALSPVGQGLSCFCPKIIIGGDGF